jgi:Tfp pilus assembly major pilin PilA
MKEMNTHDSGFGLIGVLIVIAVIIVIGAAGLVTYKHDHHKTTETSSYVKASQPKTTSKTATAKPSTSTTVTQTSSNTFAIPEFGTHMTLPAGLPATDLQYVVQNNPATTSNPTAYSTASFTTKSLLQLGSQCTAAQGAIGIISQSSTNPNTAGALQVGNYYYIFASPQGTCTGSQSGENLAQSQTALLKQAFETITTN